VPVSQFAEKLKVSPIPPNGRAQDRTIEVRGPLQIPGRADYEPDPIRVQFQVVQVPRGNRTEEQKRTQSDVIRVRGMGEEVAGEETWSGTVQLGDLRVGTAQDIQRETRGVAIAVLERKAQFAFDTITWCDEIELEDGPAQGA
jgi:hypothetical protein